MKSLVLVATIAFLSVSVQAQDIAQGKAKYTSCAACHGAQGHGEAWFKELAAKMVTILRNGN